MKRFAVLFIATVSIFSSAISYAETLPRRAFQFGPEVYRFTYEEKSLAVKDQGTMIGLRGMLTYHTENHWMYRIDLRGAWGDVDYRSGSTGSTDNIQDSVFEGRLLAGYDFIDEPTRMYTVYSGIGYRFLEDAGGGTVTTTGHLGYDRESNYYYLPLGIEGEEILSSGWIIGGSFEGDLLFSGTQKSKLSTASRIYNDVSNDQNEGWGIRGALKFRKLGDKYDVLIEPFFRLWRLENSETSVVSVSGVAAGYGVEPKNETSEWGLNLSLLF